MADAQECCMWPLGQRLFRTRLHARISISNCQYSVRCRWLAGNPGSRWSRKLQNEEPSSRPSDLSKPGESDFKEYWLGGCHHRCCQGGKVKLIGLYPHCLVQPLSLPSLSSGSCRQIVFRSWRWLIRFSTLSFVFLSLFSDALNSTLTELLLYLFSSHAPANFCYCLYIG